MPFWFALICMTRQFAHMRFLVLFALASAACAAAEETSYAALAREGGSFPGYGVDHRGALCIVTAFDPTDGGKPAVFVSPKDMRFDTSKAKAYAQPSSSIHIFGRTEFPHAVPFEAEFVLKAGDRLVAVSPDGGRVEGKLAYNPANGEDYSSSFGPLGLDVFIEDENTEPAVVPGSPVFSMDSGNVVGTVVVRRSVVKPHNPVQIPGRFRIEPLCLPTGEKPEPEMMSAYGGLAFPKPVPRDVFRWLLPGCLWDLEVGMSRETLEQKRGKLSMFREDFKDNQFIIREDTPICYQVQYIPGPDKESRGRAVEIKLEGSTNLHLGEYPKAERLVAALEQAFGKPRLFTASLNPTGWAGTQLAAHWVCGERSLTMRMAREPMAISVYLVVSESKSSTMLEMIQKKEKMGSAPASMPAAYKQWLGGFEEK
jgi:hypothetical protein